MPETGEDNLAKLLAGMAPRLDPKTYVFLTCDQVPEGLTPLMTFQEEEGLTVIAEQGAAKAAGLEGSFECRRLTLEIYSALEAVGFIARIASHLAAAGMGVNPVSAYYHDHLFVPAGRAEDAMELLRALAEA